MMKVKLKALIKSDQSHFDFYENNQFIVRIGNNLCIKELDRKQYQFLPLSKNISDLYTFKVSPGNKAIFTFEKAQNILQVCSYNFKGQKKAIKMSQSNSFLPSEQIEYISLLTQQYDSTMVYGVASTNSQACLFLVDFNKMRIVAIGYINLFQDIKVNFKETLTLSICGKGFVKLLKANGGHWEAQDKLPKKLSNELICKHLWVNSDRLLLTTRTTFYLIQDSQILQTIDLQCSLVNHFLLLPSGIFLIVDNNRVKLFKEDPQESSYMSRGQIALQEQKIQRVIMNSSQDTVLFRSSSLEFYAWKTDNLNQNDFQQRFAMQKLQSLHQKSTLGNISLSSNKNLLLIIQKNLVTLWDLNKNRPTISQQFVNFSEPDSKLLNYGAINPDALSFALAFPDKIKFYRILLSKFKQYAQVAVKKCQQIVYSHGGQLVACICSARINSIITIYNTVRIRQVLTIKLNSQPTHLVWNEHDDELIISTNKNNVVCYKISDKSRCWQIQLGQNVNFLRYDYNLHRLLVSTDNWIFCVNNDKEYDKIPVKLQNFDYVFPVQGIYLMADKLGSLYSTNTLQLANLNQYKLFTKKKFKTMYKKDILICLSDLSQIVMLDCSRGLQKNQYEDEVILIQKQEVTKFFEKIKTIESDFNNLQNFMSVKLEEQRKKYSDAIEQNTQNFKKQISFMQNKLNQMQKGRINQEKQNGRLFQIVQSGQKRDIKELEDLYHKKLILERQKFFSLQQQTLEQKMTNDKLFQELEMKHNQDINTIRSQYQSKLQSQFLKIQKVKTQSIKDRKELQARIINLWEQSAEALQSLQLKKDSKIQELLSQKSLLERNFDAQIVKQRNLQDEFQNLQGTCQKLKEQIDSYKKKIEEYVNRVKLLQAQIIKKNNMVDQRNNLIQQQCQQISGLEKAKYVLSFRTSQIRKQLQPKEASIEKLKNQLFKLDIEYKKEIKNNFQLNQKLEKITKVAENSKQQCTKYKSQLKIKEKQFDQICSQIFNVVNYIDPSNWNNEFVKIYRNYVKEENHNRTRNNKEDKTAQQINRQLIHVQQSLLQASIGNEKSLKARNMDLIRKMKQNADLLKQLNEIRKELKDERQKTQRQTDQIRKLERINNEFNKSTRNITTANTRRQVASRDYRQADNSNTEISFKRTSQYVLPSQKSQKSNRVLSAHKTMMWRDDINSKRQKTKMITDLAKQLETAKNTIRRQDRMIQQLNQRLLGLPQEMLQ